MKRDSRLFSSLRGYLWVMGFFWLLGAVAVAAWGYQGSFLVLNRYHFSWGDLLMPHFTHLGEGAVLPALLGLVLLRRDAALVTTVLVTMVAVTLLVAIAKNYLFVEWLRPLGVFRDSGEIIHYIALRRWAMHAFPSGHSAAATAVFMFFAFASGAVRPWTSWLWGLLAAAVCYSRLYIGVHFPGDVLAGSLLGAVLGLAGLWGLYPWLGARLAGFSPAAMKWLRMGLGAAALLAIAGGLYLLLNTYYLHGPD